MADGGEDVMKSTTFFTFGEIEADQLCARAGVIPVSSACNAPKRGAEYVLALAEQIKNERIAAVIELAGRT